MLQWIQSSVWSCRAQTGPCRFLQEMKSVIVFQKSLKYSLDYKQTRGLWLAVTWLSCLIITAEINLSIHKKLKMKNLANPKESDHIVDERDESLFGKFKCVQCTLALYRSLLIPQCTELKIFWWHLIELLWYIVGVALLNFISHLIINWIANLRSSCGQVRNWMTST